MDQQLLSLATLAEQFESMIVSEAAAGLAKLVETKTKPLNCPVDPIKKLKAAHSLRQNRERLHVFLSYSLTMEEFKSKFSPPEEFQNAIDAVIAKEKMIRFAKKRAALYTLLQPVKLPPKKQLIPTKLKKDRKVANVIPFPQRQSRRRSDRSCLSESIVAAR